MADDDDFRTASPAALRAALDTLYADYLGCLNEERLEEWPDFFTDSCIYKIVPRENFERGLPLATWLCESKGYLKDRVLAIRKTSVYAPRSIRRIVSGLRVRGWAGDVLETRADYAAFETLLDDVTRVFNVGAYHDLIVVENDRLKFKQKICVFDSMLVPNSLIYPL